MINRIAAPLRAHLHVLIIVPLAVIATTWPTFPRIFDPDEFWLHAMHNDVWFKIWDSWHIERVLAGQADLYFTELLYHPSGLPLAFNAYIFPHALLLAALKTVLPLDDANNLLFLLMLCFNGFCAYPLISHLVKDKWIALFGAVVFALATPFPFGQTVPDLIMIGTLPLTIYFIYRSLAERSRLFAGLAGFIAGITAFISVYVFAFILITVGILAAFKALSHWKRLHFWRALLLFIIVCGAASAWRFYPMLLNRALLNTAADAYEHTFKSNDFLEHFVLSSNPLTSRIFSAALGTTPYAELAGIRPEYKDAYLGYINLFLIACAILRAPSRRRLLPWIVILVFFATLRLGGYLTFSGVDYRDIIMPEHLLRAWFPVIFRNIGHPGYYQIGVVAPLAALASCGLAALLRSKPAKTRRLIALLCIFVVGFEFYIPRQGQTLAPNKTAFIPWLQAEPEADIALVHLPLATGPSTYYFYMQTLTGYPQANGTSNRLEHIARRYINGNLLLHTWDINRNIHCLPHNKQSFNASLDQLLADGFSHIVLHNWVYGDHFIIQSFENIPPAYDNGYVSVYRLTDMRLSCQNQAAEWPRFIQLAQSPSATPGSQSAILSIHPHQAIDRDLFDYLGALFSDWRSLLHLYRDKGALTMQSAGARYPDVHDFIKDNQVIHLLYNTREARPVLPNSQASFEEFTLCQREESADGAVLELYINRQFSCELVTSGAPFKVQYDNDARLENLLVQIDRNTVDLQLRWSNLPDEAYSVSIQVFDAAGEKVLGQDSVIGHVTLGRHQLDVSALPPGDYRLKLIMYDYESGAIVSGTPTGDGARFDRELLIANWNRN